MPILLCPFMISEIFPNIQDNHILVMYLGIYRLMAMPRLYQEAGNETICMSCVMVRMGYVILVNTCMKHCSKNVKTLRVSV